MVRPARRCFRLANIAEWVCIVDLFRTGRTCQSEGAGPICYNPEEDVPHGPADSFFAPCAGAAYTYPDGTSYLRNSFVTVETRELCRKAPMSIIVL